LFTWSAAAWGQASRSSSGNSGGFSGNSNTGFTGNSGSGFTGNSGSGFTGNSGTGFTGNSGSFSGSNSNSFTGSQSTNTGRGGGGSNNIPTQSNPFQTYYANPLAAGMGVAGSTTTTKTAFGQPLYKQTTTSGTNTGNYGGRGGSTLSGYAGAATSPVSGSSMGMRRDAIYTSTVDFRVPPVTQLAVRADLQQIIGASTSLPSKDNIKVMSDGSVVVLRGSVANVEESKLAEGLVRLTPGVYNVRNELQVGPAPATTAGVDKKP
jgi:hypothetical protein